MSDDKNGSSGGPARRPKRGFDVTHALLHTETLNADKTRRIPVLQAVFECQLQRALAGDSRAAELVISLAERSGIWHTETMPRSYLNLDKLSDDELETLAHLTRKAQDSMDDDSDGSRFLSTD